LQLTDLLKYLTVDFTQRIVGQIEVGQFPLHPQEVWRERCQLVVGHGQHFQTVEVLERLRRNRSDLVVIEIQAHYAWIAWQSEMCQQSFCFVVE
jgi:hypothetical protein